MDQAASDRCACRLLLAEVELDLDVTLDVALSPRDVQAHEVRVVMGMSVGLGLGVLSER